MSHPHECSAPSSADHWRSLCSQHQGVRAPSYRADACPSCVGILWVKLVQLFTLTVQHKLKVSDIEHLDDYQVEHATLFAAVPEYAGLDRPKNHFLTQHVPGDVWRYGPPRGYWCFGFESFNKVLKAGAARSNWQRESLTIMRYWSLYHARQLVVKRRRVVHQVI